MKRVYIASVYRGDRQQNEAFAKMAVSYAIQQEVVPIAPHLLYPQVLDDDDPIERAIGIVLAKSLLTVCDELWLCGDRITEGMKAEWELAREMQIPVRCVPKQEIQKTAMEELPPLMRGGLS